MEKLEPMHSVGGNVKWYIGYRKQCKDLTQKLNLERQYDLAIKLLGIYPKELILQFQRYICILMIIAALFTIT